VNVEQLVRDTLHDMTDDAPRPPADLADRVLGIRRRRRVRTIAGAAAATVAVLVAAFALPALGLTDRADGPPATVTDTTGVVAHPDQSPPRDLIAAGDTALSAYWTSKWVTQSGSGAKATLTLQRTWYLYNTSTGRYAKSLWAYLDVASGMRTAAVLEGPLPSKRVGLLDLATGKVTRWIELEPCGRRVLVPEGRQAGGDDVLQGAGDDDRHAAHQPKRPEPDRLLPGGPRIRGEDLPPAAAGHVHGRQHA
jgi:hypothetical protein